MPRYLSLVVWLLGLSICLPVLADEPAAKPVKAADEPAAAAAPKFLRLNRDDKGNLVSMDTAIVRYESTAADRQGTVVDLIGVVHIGEKSYYQQLNKEFEQYDALLYELVAPEGRNVPRPSDSSRHPLAAMQNGMKDVLELEYQLAHIDYQKKNFVHADMSPDAFSKSMDDRGESLWQIVLRSMGQGIALESRNQGKAGGATSGAGLLMAWFSPNRSLVLKRMMAEQFEDLETSMKTFEGPDGSTIISERNKVALRVLEKQLTEGKKRIGIFYGAGHMADMEKRLTVDLGFKRQDERWLAAWDLKGKRPASSGGKAVPKDDKPADQPVAEPAKNEALR